MVFKTGILLEILFLEDVSSKWPYEMTLDQPMAFPLSKMILSREPRQIFLCCLQK